MNRVLLISSGNTDFDLLLQRCCSKLTRLSPEAEGFDPSEFDALCVLGGDGEEPLTLAASLRTCLEQMRAEGKPMFVEFLRSIGAAYMDKLIPTSHHRMVFDGKTFPVPSLRTGDLLDGHSNDCIRYVFQNQNTHPILTYHDYVCAHAHIEMTEEEYKKGIWALWQPDANTLVASFRLCNFRRARLAPRHAFETLLTAVLRFLTADKELAPAFRTPVCTYQKQEVHSVSDVHSAIENGMAWFERAKILKKDGRGGVYEGFSHQIRAMDGIQQRQNEIRTDCTGEVAGAFRFHALYTGNEESRQISDTLFSFCFRYMQIHDGEHRGMLRWTETAWETCYQDDVARTILPLLLCQHIDGNVPYFSEIRMALDYLLDTTGTNGLRVARTDCCELSQEKRQTLRSTPGLACAHYNAFYLTTLLLAYRICGDHRYFETALRGLSTLMSLYPDTVRETSETEENCRLLLPLSVLYEITRAAEHYAWLCSVADYLEKHRHASGAVSEWDTGYQANCSRNHTGECALLAENGDPVADLLYSNNWLPLGYAYAYLATGEERFAVGWKRIASFLLSCQIHSEDPWLDGAWSRAFDPEAWESYGVPHDVGWAPCCIESGWTVAEILMGLQFMRTAEKRQKAL